MHSSSTSTGSGSGSSFPLPLPYVNSPLQLYNQINSSQPAYPSTTSSSAPSSTSLYSYQINPHSQAYPAPFNANLARAPYQPQPISPPSFLNNQLHNSPAPPTSLPPLQHQNSPPTPSYHHHHASLNSPAALNPPSKQIHRTRPSYSCVLCRQRRVKCDRAKPSCGKCNKMGVPCQWSLDNPEVYDSSTVDARGVKRMRTDGDLAGQDSPRGRASRSPGSGREEGRASSGTEKDLKGSLEKLTEVLMALKNTVAGVAKEGQQMQQGAPAALTKDLGEVFERTRIVVEENLKSLNLDSQGVSCGGLGDKFWEHISHEISDLRETLSQHKQKGSLSVSTTERDHSAAPLFCNGLERPPVDPNIGSEGIDYPVGSEVQQCLPHKNQCDFLLKLFFQNINPLLNVLHYPTFMESYDEFWTLYNQVGGAIPAMPSNPGFAAILFSAMYSVTAVAPHKVIKDIFGDEIDVERLTSRFKFATSRYLDNLEFWTQPTLATLQAYVVLYFDSVKNIRKVLELVWTSMRAAYHLRLFQDGQSLGMSVVETELRRRMWWYLLQWDIEVAIVTGSPPVASADEAANTKFPSVLKDSLISNDNVELYNADPSTHTPDQVSGYMIYHASSYEMSVLRKKIIRRLHAVVQPSRKDLEDLGIEIFAARKRMAERIKQIPLDASIPNFWEPEFAKDVDHQLTLNRYSRVMISGLADRTYTLLYQPFLKSTRGQLWNHTRSCALRACHAFMRKFIYLRDTPIFAHLRWTMTIACPIQPITIVLIDLHARPFSAESTRSRVLSDACFALVEKIQPWTKDWEMLKRLRAKAYERAGVPIDVIGSENDWNVRREDVEKEITSIDKLLDSDFKCPAELSMLAEEMLVKRNQDRGPNGSNGSNGPSGSNTGGGGTGGWPMSGDNGSQAWHNTSDTPAKFSTFGDWGFRKQLSSPQSALQQPPSFSSPHTNGSPSCGEWSHGPDHQTPSTTTGETLSSSESGTRSGCEGDDVGCIPAIIGGGGDARVQQGGGDQMDGFAWDEWDNMFGQYIDLDISDMDKQASPFWQLHSSFELV